MPASQKERLDYLLQQYASGIASDAEVAELAGLLKDHRYEPEVKLSLEALSYKATPTTDFSREDIDSMIGRILEMAPAQAKVIPMHRTKWLPRIAAAVVLLLMATGGYFLFRTKNIPPVTAESQQERYKNDVAPGHTGAVLTLADGSKINLDSATYQKLTQGRTNIVNNNNELAYHETGTDPKVAYNTLTTTKGQTYALVLADGSKVWLNAASSIHYPVSFNGNDRTVDITGEAYFEVAHDAKRPFHVMTNGEEVQVLGTHFDVNAYNDEAFTRTTLLEGSVKVTLQQPDNLHEISKIIVPGQQVAGSKGVLNINDNPNLDEVMAWKDGKFDFNNADIQTIMRQVTRWYDVDVEYKGTISRHFVADVSRDVPVSKLLQLLELTDRVHFTIEGRKITVMP